jgi:UDP-GlcNAc:undecaprenyl-phosphate GlcNAc-1-phosphate transferase
MFTILLGSVAAAFVLSVVGTRVAIALAPRLRFVDQPGAEAHKQQQEAVPYGGGIAMAIALAVGLIACAQLSVNVPGMEPMLDRAHLWPIYAGALALLGVGLIDDRRPLPARAKLIIQMGVAAAVVPSADLGIDSLQDYPALAYGLAWLWLVMITNAFNLLDHADGLSASVAIVSITVLLALSLMDGDLRLAALWLTLIAVLLGFLVWNLPPAKVYMGDAGSLPLGFLIGAGTLSVTFWPSGTDANRMAVLSPLIITAIPLFDAAVVVVKRLANHKPIFLGDRNHISHRLGRLGYSPRVALGVVVALQVALAASALVLRLGDPVAGGVVLAQDAAILVAVLLIETVRDRHVD